MELINKIREQLGFPEFVKVDPNTHHVKNEDQAQVRQLLGQATTTSVLMAMYRLSRSEEGFNYLVNKDANVPWSVLLFGDNSEPVAESIGQYSGADMATVHTAIDETGSTAWSAIEQHLEGKMNYKNLGDYLSTERNTLLTYLPPQLDLGKKLHDNSMDDRTNKMEGPVSGIMHKIEKMFSGPQEKDRLENF